MEATELQVLLKSSGHSQEWVAAQLGVSTNAIWKWAHDRLAIPESRAATLRALLSSTCPVCGADRDAA